jgi:hypothetical protein
MTNLPKTHENTDIEITGVNDSGDYFGGVRIAKSDTVNASGAKLQIYLSSGWDYGVMKSMNTGNVKGWELVTPYLDDTPTLPDGITAATFIEAGAELSLNSGTTLWYPQIAVTKSNDDQLRFMVQWPEIPKQGTNIAITFPSTRIDVKSIGGPQITLSSGSITMSNFVIDGKNVRFFINDAGAFSTLSFEPAVMYVVGTGCKLTITG